MSGRIWDLAAWSKQPFQSQAEVIDAMKDERYGHPLLGHEYSAAVQDKLAISFNSAVGITTTVNKNATNGTQRFRSAIIGSASASGVVSVQPNTVAQDEYQKALNELAALRGPSAARSDHIGDVAPSIASRLPSNVSDDDGEK